MNPALSPPETTAINQAEVNAFAWKASESFRAGGDAAECRNHVLALLFLKYISENWKRGLDQYRREFQGDEERIRRRMSRERFVLTEGCEFDALHAKRDEPDFGEIINRTFEQIEEANKSKLDGLFHNIDFNAESLGETRERNQRLKRLIEDLADPRLDLPRIGAVCRRLIQQFAGAGGPRSGVWYTPEEVSDLLAKLLRPRKGARICDPACGSGSLLLRLAEEVGDRDLALYGQESDGAAWALCRMNLFMNGQDSARIERGDVLSDPKLLDRDALQTFDIVVTHPPLPPESWDAEAAAHDRFRRFHRGIPPKGKSDYAFVTHLVETTRPDTGQAALLLPHGALFRGGAERNIRRRLVEENLLDCVIGLPPNLFYGTAIPAALLLFRRGRTTTDVLFIDASRACEAARPLSRLRPQDIEAIVTTYRKFETAEQYACRATVEAIRENEFNLSLSRYVNARDAEDEMDPRAAQEEIEGLEAELARVRDEMRAQLEALALDRPA
jgi:type I restriction enzyme M protein